MLLLLSHIGCWCLNLLLPLLLILIIFSFFRFYHSPFALLSFNNFLSRLISVAEHDNRIIKIHNFSEALDNDGSSNSSSTHKRDSNEVSLCKRQSTTISWDERVLKILIYGVYVCVVLCCCQTSECESWKWKYY